MKHTDARYRGRCRTRDWQELIAADQIDCSTTESEKDRAMASCTRMRNEAS